MNPNLDPLADIPADDDVLSVAELSPAEETLDSLDPLASSGTALQESVEEALAAIPVMVPVSPAAPVARSRRVLAGLKFALYYCLVSAGVFVVLQAAANFTAYSEFVLDIIDPGRYQASSEHITHQIAQAQVAVTSAESGVVSTGAAARAQILGRRLENTSLDARAIDVLSAIRDPNPYSPAAIAKSDAVSLDIDIVPYENRIVIPKINKNVPLVDIDPRSGMDFSNLESIFMKELERGVVRYPGTALPGNTGNAFIFGHSSNYPWMPGDYNQVFAMLDKLEWGDEIIVYYRQKKYTYVVKEKKVVKPGNVKSLERDETKAELSLMTCWPLGTNINRLLIFAELQPDQAPASVAAASADTHTDA